MTRSLRFLGCVLPLALALLQAACGGERAAERRGAEAATNGATTTRAAANEALVASFIEEVWAKKHAGAVPKYVAADLVNHAAIPEAQGAAGFETIARKLHAAFPDLKMHVIGISSDGDDVVVRTVFEGTHSGDLAFKRPIPATNKHVKVDQVHTFRVKDGKIVEAWMVMDHLEMLTQLGVGPGAPRPANDWRLEGGRGERLRDDAAGLGDRRARR